MGNKSFICMEPKQDQNYRISKKNINTLTKSETEQTPFSKNKSVANFKLGDYAQIETILGHYSLHSSDALVAISTLQCISFCQELREYAQDSKSASEKIKEERTTVNLVKVKKGCPYEKLILCIVQDYHFKEHDEKQIYQYYRNFRTLMREVFRQNNRLTLYLTPTSQQGVIFPTQTLLALLFKQLCTCLNRTTKISMISCQAKMLQMIRYELLKTEACLSSLGDWQLRALPGPITIGQI